MRLFDRYSDLALITGFALSLQGDILLGLLALGGVFMASYMGTQAQAVGLKRNYGGVLGRADRLILMIIAIRGTDVFSPGHKTIHSIKKS